MDLTGLTSQLKLNTNFNANSTFGLNDINGITGLVDNSTTSLKALIFNNRTPEMDDTDPTDYDVTGITSENFAFVFDIKKDYRFNLSSEITDHYTEDNRAVQDQIGLKPIIIEVNGVIGELDLKSGTKRTQLENRNKQKKNNNFTSVESFVNRMGSLTSFAPNVVSQALNLYNSAKGVINTAKKLININKKVEGNKITKGQDQTGFSVSKQYWNVLGFQQKWEQRASFTIVTPYGVFNDMYIMDLSATQPDNTRYLTNLSIKFKQIRFAQTITKQIKKKSQTNDIQTNKNSSNNIEDKKFSYNVGDSNKTDISGISYDIKKYSTTSISEIEEVKYTTNISKGTGKISKDSINTNNKSFGL